MTVHFGRIVYPLVSHDNEGAAQRLANHLRHNKGIDTEVVSMDYQNFVLTGKDLTRFRYLRQQYESQATEILNAIEAASLPKAERRQGTSTLLAGTMRLIGGGAKDWGSIATGPDGFPSRVGVAQAGEQLEAVARQTRQAMQRLIREKVQLWFPNDENNVVKGEMYNGGRRGELLDALFAKGERWDHIRENVSGIVQELTAEHNKARKPLSIQA